MILDENQNRLRNIQREFYGKLLFYQDQIPLQKRNNSYLEWAITIFSSGIVGLSIWDIVMTEENQIILIAMFGTIAAFFGFIKLLLKPMGKIEQFSKQYRSYNGFLFQDLEALGFQIKGEDGYTDREFNAEFAKILYKQGLIAEEDVTRIEDKLTQNQKDKIDDRYPKFKKIEFRKGVDLIS